MKNPLTLAGIEPATFRFVAQHLNHCATAVPPIHYKEMEFMSYIFKRNNIKEIIGSHFTLTNVHQGNSRYYNF